MKNLNELRVAIREEWQRSVYDGYHGPAPLRDRAWLQLLERIEAYANECIAQTVDLVDPAEPEQSTEQAAETTSVTSESVDETPTIDVNERAQPKSTRRTTAARRSTPR